MSDAILSRIEEGVLYLSINRADKKNALTLAMYQTLCDELVAADENPEVAVVHLTGSGDSFCAGNDIADFVEASRAGNTKTPALDFLLQLNGQRKPVVVAVNGIAVGIGVTLLLHCDFVYAAKGSMFRMPFVDLGLVPEGGSSVVIPQLVGHRKAAELLLACDAFDADAAEEYGIVNKAVAPDQLLATSTDMAKRLAAKPPKALLQAKAMLKANVGQPLEQVIPAEVELFMQHLVSEEASRTLAALFGGKS